MSSQPDETHIPVDGDQLHNGRRNKYAKYNKEKRDQMLFWAKVTVFSVGLLSCVLSLTIPSLREATLRTIAVWKWCVLITALLAGLVLSQVIHWLVLVLVEYEISMKENAIYYVVGTIESAWVVLWCGMILVAWTWVVDEPSDIPALLYDEQKVLRKFAKTTHLVTLTLLTILLGSLLWLIKDVLIMVGKSSFHVRRFFVRVRKTLTDEYIIKNLWKGSLRLRNIDAAQGTDQSNKNKPLDIPLEGEGLRGKCCRKMMHKLKPPTSQKKLDMDRIIHATKKTQRIYLKSLEDVDEETVSCWAMKILIEKIMKAGERIPYTDYRKDQPENFIGNEDAAIRVADDIFSAIFPQDFEESKEARWKYYVDTLEKGSEMSEWINEESDSREINPEVFRKCMVRAWRYRRSLVRALQDNKQIFIELNRFVNVMLLIIIILIWLVMVHVEFRRAIVVAGTAIVGSAFIFGDFCKKLLDNFSLVFVVHPFDVGDCCLIEGTPVIIEKMNLLSTIALTLENEKRHYPNANLCGLVITNYTRSPSDMGDSAVFFLDISTSDQQIQYIKSQIESYLKMNEVYWHPEYELVMELEAQDMTAKIKATLEFKHKMKFHDFKEIKSRKTKLVAQLIQILHELTKQNGTSRASEEAASSDT